LVANATFLFSHLAGNSVNLIGEYAISLTSEGLEMLLLSAHLVRELIYITGDWLQMAHQLLKLLTPWRNICGCNCNVFIADW
jgi:hypothetical protein